MPLSRTLPLLAVRTLLSAFATAEIELPNAAMRNVIIRRSYIIENPYGAVTVRMPQRPALQELD